MERCSTTSLELMIQGVNVSTPFMVVNSSALRVLIIGGGPIFAFWQGVDGEDVKLGTIGDEALLRFAEASSN